MQYLRQLMNIQTPKFHFGLALVAPSVFIAISILFNLLPNYLYGEEFYIFQYANNLSHVDAWQTFFLENGRLVEGIYWTYLYKLVGYQPIILRSISLILHLIGTLLATLAITRILPHRDKKFTVFISLVIFFNWISLEDALRISTDNIRISIIFFWATVNSLQLWMMKGRKWWRLLLSYSLFLIALNSYENTALLFPVAVLLTWPLRPQKRKDNNKGLVIRLSLITLLGMFLLIIPFILYRYVQSTTGVIIQHPAGELLSGDLSIFFQRFVGVFNKIIAYLLYFGRTDTIESVVWVEQIYFASFLLLLGILVKYCWPRLISFWKDIDLPSFHLPPRIGAELVLFGAGILIILSGFLPYALAGYPASTRVYTASYFGVILLLILAWRWSQSKLAYGIIVLFSLIHISYAINLYLSSSSYLVGRETTYHRIYTEIKEVVPGVKDETTLVLLNFRLNGASCGASINMLYNRQALKCVVISNNEPTYSADRYEEAINGHYGGWIRNSRLIILGYESGELSIIQEISPEDDYLVNWYSTAPIVTDIHTLILENTENDSRFYQHLLIRDQVVEDPSPE